MYIYIYVYRVSQIEYRLGFPIVRAIAQCPLVRGVYHFVFLGSSAHQLQKDTRASQLQASFSFNYYLTPGSINAKLGRLTAWSSFSRTHLTSRSHSRRMCELLNMGVSQN